MHVLFVHQNYPAQFGHLARRLVTDFGWECTFVSYYQPTGVDGGVRCIQYEVKGGATEDTHYCSRTFENNVWHAHAVAEACEREMASAPDLIVGHSSLASTLFLRELFACPIINYFEYFYRVRESDADFRHEFRPTPLDLMRARARNAMILLDLENCDAGYSPTHWQRSRFPEEFLPKIEVIFDGIETDFWRRKKGVPRRVGDQKLKRGTRVVTYAAPGLEFMRGFDIFMQTARRIYEMFPDVVFVVAGGERTRYGPDERMTGGLSFKEYVLKNGDYDLSRFIFTGPVPPARLVELFSLSDLHIFLTVPFVLSWSVFNALACECVLLASDTAPVREVVRHQENGLLADFYDVEGLARQAVEVLRQPEKFRALGQEGAALVRSRYSLDYCLPRLADFYSRTARRPAPG